jgi:hypothetical protein
MMLSNRTRIILLYLNFAIWTALYDAGEVALQVYYAATVVPAGLFVAYYVWLMITEQYGLQQSETGR